MLTAMEKWIQESKVALAMMERELEQQNAAVEAAMMAIRHHSQVIEELEQNIAFVRDTVSRCTGGGPVETEEMETSVAHRPLPVRDRPQAPPLRPVGSAPPPPPRLVARG